MNDKIYRKFIRWFRKCPHEQYIHNKTYYTVEELKASLKRTLLDEIKYYGFYMWWDFITDLRWKVPNYFQRAYHGVGNADTWGFDSYLTIVIIRGLTHLRNNLHGCPTDIANKYDKNKYLTRKEKDCLMMQEWRNILTTIIKGLEANRKMFEPNLDKKTIEYYQTQFKKSFELFGKYYNDLWD